MPCSWPSFRNTGLEYGLGIFGFFFEGTPSAAPWINCGPLVPRMSVLLTW
jgi:hypothetical protein